MGFSPSRSSICFNRERGAALFVALIMLVLLTLLGVTAMQVTVLQERMAGNFRIQLMAFEATEGRISEGQQLIRDVLRVSDDVPANPVALATGTNELPWEAWLKGVQVAPDDEADQLKTAVRYCVACPGKLASVPGEDPTRKPRYYVLSGIDFDTSGDATAVLQSIYVN